MLSYLNLAWIASNVKLNDITKELTKDVECSLHVDDFVIFIRLPHSDKNHFILVSSRVMGTHF